MNVGALEVGQRVGRLNPLEQEPRRAAPRETDLMTEGAYDKRRLGFCRSSHRERGCRCRSGRSRSRHARHRRRRLPGLIREVEKEVARDGHAASMRDVDGTAISTRFRTLRPMRSSHVVEGLMPVLSRRWRTLIA
jgi:hypothetical protein